MSTTASNSSTLCGNMMNNQFASKQAFFAHLQEILLQHSPLENSFNNLVHTSIGIYLKYKTSLFTNQMSSLNVEAALKELEDNVLSSSKIFPESSSNCKFNLKEKTVFRVFQVLASLVSSNEIEEDDKIELFEASRLLDEKVPIIGNEAIYSKIFEWIKLILNHLDTFSQKLDHFISSAPQVDESTEEKSENLETDETTSESQNVTSVPSDQMIEKKKKKKKTCAEKRRLKKQKTEEKAELEQLAKAAAKTKEEELSECCQKCDRTNEMAQKIINENEVLETEVEKESKEKDYYKKLYKELLEKKRNEQIQQNLQKAEEEEEEEEMIDMECLICHDDMETTKDTLKCTNCNRHYHKDCLSKWFQTSRMCPVCECCFPEGVEN